MSYPNVPNLEPLPEPKLRELLAQAQAGDTKARNKIVEHNLKLVCVLIARFNVTTDLYGDLLQEGALGLVKAVERFDLTRDTKFISYASWWVLQNIFKWFAQNRSMVVHPSQRNRPYDTSLDAGASFLNDPSDKDELAGIQFLPDLNISPETQVVHTEEIDVVAEFVDKLSRLSTNYDRTQDIIKSRFLTDSPETLESIGARWNCSRERIRQCECKIKESCARLKRRS